MVSETVKPAVQSDALKLAQERSELLADYLKPDEKVVGFVCWR